MKRFLKILLWLFIGVIGIFILLAAYLYFNHKPNWDAETDAVQSLTHPLAGFWKDEGCHDPWGFAIGPYDDNLYYISFCGPGGCFEKGSYRPNTSIINDSDYKVIDENTIMFRSDNGWSKNVRCEGRI